MRMKALSVRQPWAWALFHGKDVENRSWPLPRHILGQTIAIHASSYKHWLWWDLSPEQLDATKPPSDLPILAMGSLIGTVKIAGQLPMDAESLWKEKGQYGFVFAEAKEFEKPIPCKGKLGFFEVEI